MVKIYIDVLLVTNIAINVVQIWTAGALCNRAAKPLRLMIASSIGALASLTVLMPSKVLIAAVKVAVAFISCAAAFRERKPLKLIKLTCALGISKLVFLSLVYLLSFFTGTARIYIIYGTIYLDVSVLSLVAACCGCYLIVSVIERLCFARHYGSGAYSASFVFGEKNYRFEAIADTGNCAKDYLTGKPVVVFMSGRVCEEMELDSRLPEGFRLLPYETASGDGLMWITDKAKVTITDGKGNSRTPDAYLGFVRSDSEKALFNPCLLLQ